MLYIYWVLTRNVAFFAGAMPVDGGTETLCRKHCKLKIHLWVQGMRKEKQ